MRVAGPVRRHVSFWVLGTALLLAAVSAPAAPLRNIPQTLTQPDGTVVHLLATGDEYYNRLHDASGFTVVRDPDTGYLVYAMKIDGRLQPTGFIVGKDDPAAAGLTPDLMPDPRTLPSPDELYPITQHHARVRTLGLANAPAFSAVNNLVVFISFADEPTPGFQSLPTYTTWFDSTASPDASMKRYFLEASYGVLTIDSTFYPASSGTTVASYRDSHNRSYYKPYDATTNPDGYKDDQRNAREWTLLQAAVNSIAPQVPAGLDLDTNHDGYIDSVVFVVSGSAVNADWANLLWPHRWAIDDTHYPAPVNGKLLGDYNLQLDGNMQVGVLCHEMTHLLGAPDLYRYDTCSSDSNLTPVGDWDLMANDKNPPQQMSAYLKWRYLGFIPSIPTATAGSHTLNPLSSATNNCYRISSPNSASEYFVVEYRKRSFPFENSVPGSGLLVYRIDTAADGQGNRCGPPDEVYVYRPGGTPTSNGNLKQAFFTSDAVPPRTAINDATDPSSALSDWFPGGLSIHDIGAAGSTISFTVDSVAACTQPGAFALASPANGGNVAGSGTATLTWGASAGASSYDVYFGTDQNPPLVGNQSGTSLAVAVTDGTTYFWRVAAKNACAQVFAPASGTWAFSAGASSGGITIFSDDFEGDLSKWKLGNTAGASAAAWGIVSCKTKDGNGAAWCAGGGSAAQPACTQYVPGEGTFLIAGPFDLTDAVDGTWDFDLWTDIDDGGNPSDPPDVVYWMWSLDGRSFSGGGTSGNSGGWEHETIRMADMTMGDGTPVTGKPKVYFAFLFLSDAATQKEGAYVDNVVIKKMLQGQTSYDHWLPAVIHKDVPSRNAWWRSDVAVVNRSSQPANVTLKVYA
ncbi:MAG: M6 family metalloprotease domain-containing protein, partial [Acidobacteria bacterium]